MKGATLPEIAEVVRDEPEGRRWLDDAAVRARAATHLTSELTRESWKYTPLASFLAAFGEADSAPAARIDGIDQPGVRAVPLDDMGAEDEAHVRRAIADDLDADRHLLADLGLLRARGGWLVVISGAPAAPVEIRYAGGGIAPVFVRLEPGAAATVMEHLDGDRFLTQMGHVQVGTNARLHHYRAAFQRDVGHYAMLRTRLERDAHYTLNQILVGGSRRRAELHVVMDGQGAEADLSGAYLVEAGQHLDQQLTVEHRAGHARSRQKFHGIGAGKGRSVFNGRIHIHPDTPDSDAQLANRNLALHPEAEMNTKPELEIYTDDVRCAHGATVGQLSVEALFFLTARGIPEPAARRLLAHGFVRECMSGPLADAAAERFAEAL